ncbi:MAG: CPBP family glutamic-type intramembrane protease [Anaerolineales bacterium]
MKAPSLKFSSLDNADVGALIVALFVLAFLIAIPVLGFWEAVRGVLVEAVILAASFTLARQYLPWEDAPRERIKNPRWEMALAIVGILVFYVAWPQFLPVADATSLFLNMMLATASLGAFAAAAFMPFGYALRTWGLKLPTGRELLVLAGVAVITIGGSWLFGSILPLSEAPDVASVVRPVIPGALLWSFGQGIQQGLDLLPLLILMFAFSVFGQELFFRVYLQARLAHYLPGRWALFVQSALYFVATLVPFYILTGWTLPGNFALTQVALLSNGVLAGYFWRKTGSLPLLILLHLLAFSRWGL